MHSVTELQRRMALTLRQLEHANGEWAEVLEQTLRMYRSQLERAIALTAGVACVAY